MPQQASYHGRCTYLACMLSIDGSCLGLQTRLKNFVWWRPVRKTPTCRIVAVSITNPLCEFLLAKSQAHETLQCRTLVSSHPKVWHLGLDSGQAVLQLSDTPLHGGGLQARHRAERALADQFGLSLDVTCKLFIAFRTALRARHCDDLHALQSCKCALQTPNTRCGFASEVGEEEVSNLFVFKPCRQHVVARSNRSVFWLIIQFESCFQVELVAAAHPQRHALACNVVRARNFQGEHP